jgi:hypothetical protein
MVHVGAHAVRETEAAGRGSGIVLGAIEMQGRSAGAPRLPMPATSKAQEVKIRAALQRAGAI